MTEFDKLEMLLKEKGVEYERTDSCVNDFHQICVPSNKEKQWDAIWRPGSYGYQEGLLEIMGVIVYEDLVGDSVEGYLTAEEVIDRLDDYNDPESREKRQKRSNFKYSLELAFEDAVLAIMDNYDEGVNIDDETVIEHVREALKEVV